jgi:hypothetical protein
LPYHVSIARGDEFFEAIEMLTGDDEVKSVMVLGAASGEGPTEAFVEGLSNKKDNSPAVCINRSTRRFRRLKTKMGGNSALSFHEISQSAPQSVGTEVENIVKTFKEEHRLSSIDAVLIDPSSLEPEIGFSPNLKAELRRAKYIVLDDINGSLNFQNYDDLLADSNYAVLACNPGLRNGYAIFSRMSTVATRHFNEHTLTAFEWNGSRSEEPQ